MVAVPEEGKRSNFRRFKSHTTDHYGKFDLHGLAPGSDQIFSWTGIGDRGVAGRGVFEALREKGESVEVRDDGVTTVNWKVIEKKSE